MARLLPLVGFGGGFLMVSPKLREQVMGLWLYTASTVKEYSPYSYIAVALGIFLLLTALTYRNSTAIR